MQTLHVVHQIPAVSVAAVTGLSTSNTHVEPVFTQSSIIAAGAHENGEHQEVKGERAEALWIVGLNIGSMTRLRGVLDSDRPEV